MIVGMWDYSCAKSGRGSDNLAAEDLLLFRVRGCSQSTWKRRGEGGSANIPQFSTAGGGASEFPRGVSVLGSNNYAFFCAAYMTDVVSHQTDGIPEAIYVDGEEQRKWFCDCLLQATLVLCPRINERRTTFLMTNPPLSEFIFSA